MFSYVRNKIYEDLWHETNILILIIYMLLNNLDHELEAKKYTKVRFIGLGFLDVFSQIYQNLMNIWDMKLNILGFIYHIKNMNSSDYQFRAHWSEKLKWLKGFNRTTYTIALHMKPFTTSSSMKMRGWKLFCFHTSSVNEYKQSILTTTWTIHILCSRP